MPITLLCPSALKRDYALEEKLAFAQSLKYAEELQELYGAERTQPRIAEDALAQLEASYRTTVRALAAALELRDDQSGAHAERVTELALRLARRVSRELVSDPELEYGFLLHDLGKIGVPDAVALKPGPLDDDEMETMRRHVELGEQIVERIPYLAGVARDAMTNDRPYRKALAVEEALREIRSRAGTQFDPNIVRAFAALVDRLDAAA